MTKLTVSLRDDIVAAAQAKAGIDAEQTSYQTAKREWAEQVADYSLGGPEITAKIAEIDAKIASLVADLPENLRREVSSVKKLGYLTANIAGCRVHVGSWEGFRHAAGNVTITADHPLAVRFFELENIGKDIETRRIELRTKVRAALNSVNTVAQLLKVWPEAAELLPKTVAPKPNLPAIPVADLNALVGLPSEGR